MTDAEKVLMLYSRGVVCSKVCELSFVLVRVVFFGIELKMDGINKCDCGHRSND